jgi:hypothetical protein
MEDFNTFKSRVFAGEPEVEALFNETHNIIFGGDGVLLDTRLGAKKKVVAYLDSRLKIVRNIYDVNNLLEIASLLGDFTLRGKKPGRSSGNKRYAFSDFQKWNGKHVAHYLIDDGVSRGMCSYERLYYVMKFES